MKHFLEYRRASYELIMSAESRAGLALEESVEAWLVHTFARYMESPHIPTDTIAIKMLNAANQRGEIRKQLFQEIAEECVLIDGLELNSRRWPTKTYYREMGILACENRCWTDRPPELWWERLASNFPTMGVIIQNLKG